RVPLSLAQQRMWFLNQLDTESTSYNIPMALRLEGALDVEAFRAAVTDVFSRHEALRTMYPTDADGPYQVVVPTAEAVSELVVTPVEGDEAMRDAVVGMMARGFDVTAAPPSRVGLFARESNDHVFVMVVHHITADGASMAPLSRDVMQAYVSRTQGMAPEFSPLAVQYADYALWQRDVVGEEDDPGSVLSTQIDYCVATSRECRTRSNSRAIVRARRRPREWEIRSLFPSRPISIAKWWRALGVVARPSSCTRMRHCRF
ncbi:hypothetical protein QV65_31890, partial [Rhodococcus erythropolis]